MTHTPTTETYTLSLHDALPIFALLTPDQTKRLAELKGDATLSGRIEELASKAEEGEDRKSTRLNSSHEWISYAVFCLKKKTTQYISMSQTWNLMNRNSAGPRGQ